MPTEEALEKHIIQTLEKGTPQKEILKQLTKAGWPEEIIQHYIEKINSTERELSFIKIEGITTTANGKLILDRTSLTINAGELLGIIGTSGAGKSTLLYTLVGFLEPDAGDVLLTLKDQPAQSIVKHPDIIKKLTGFSPQTPAIYPKLTVKENLQHFASLYGLRGIEITERTGAVMKFVDLQNDKDTPAQNLSAAQQKRLDIACAIIHQPAFLILDEPTADLDTIAAEDVWSLITQIHKSGTTIVIATHILEEVERNCTRIAILRDKKIMEAGTPAELRNLYARNYTITIETIHQQYQKLTKQLKTAGATNISQKDARLIITTQNPDTIIAILPRMVKQCNDAIAQLNVTKATLKTIFENLVNKTKK